jgi:hypothetical protein
MVSDCGVCGRICAVRYADAEQGQIKDALKLLAEIGWALVIISPFVWRYIFNKWDDF